MNKPLLIGLVTAAGIGALSLIVLKTDWLRPVSAERIQGRIDGRLAEIDDLLDVNSIDEAGWARIVQASEPLRQLEDRSLKEPELMGAYDRVFEGPPNLDAWRVLLAEPESAEAVARWSAPLEEGVPATEEKRGLAAIKLCDHFSATARIAIEDGQPGSLVDFILRGLVLADITLQGVGEVDWLVGVMAITTTLSCGITDEACPDDLDSEGETRWREEQFVRSGERAASLLSVDQRMQIVAALEATLDRLPTTERAVLIQERFALGMIWDAAAREGGGALVVRRILDGYDVIRGELQEIARLEDPEEQRRRSDLYEERMRSAPFHFLALAAGHPLTYVSLLAPSGPANHAQTIEDARRSAGLFLERFRP